MASICVMIGSIGPSDDGVSLRYSAHVRHSDAGQSDRTIGFCVDVSPALPAATHNAQIVAAAVAACLVRGVTVGVGDRRLLVGAVQEV